VTPRAVVTGIGVIAPTGIGAASHWQASKEGRCAIRPISRFDASRYACRLAGQVETFEPADFLEKRLMVQMDRWTWMAIAATELALKDAALDPSSLDPYSIGVITASATGGNEFGQREIQSLWSKGPLYVGAYQSIAWFYAASTGQISIKHGIKGPCSVIVSEGAGGLDALGHSRRMIRRGVEAVISGATEAPIAPYALTCQMRNGRLSSKSDPNAAYRPFDMCANGYVPGEGGAILIVESLESAERRGAPRVYAEIAGHASTQDGYHHSRSAPDGRQLARAMSLALRSAGVGPEDVDLIFADAEGTLDGDLAEALAITQVFGEHASHIPVTAPKTLTGRLYSGAAALDVATALLAMCDGVAPPMINLDRPADGCHLAFVTGAARDMTLDTVLVNARGFGGFNSALVLRRHIH